MNKGSVSLDFRDVENRLLRDDGIALFFDNLSQRQRDRRLRVDLKGRRKTIKELPAHPGGNYQLFIQPNRYRGKSRFVSIQPGEDNPLLLTEGFFINPAKAKPLFPAALDGDRFQLLATVLDDSPVSYDELGAEPLRRAGLLNLHAKMQAQRVGGKPAFESVRRIEAVEQDRIFAWVGKDLLDRAEADTQSLSPADGSLHSFRDFKFLRSFKSFERTGNVQFTFFRGQGGPEGTLLCDCDIDDHQGIAHAFDVIGHRLTGEETHPYDIHQVLWTQGIDPGYRLE